MGSSAGPGMRDLAEARCALADVGRALSQARREMSRLRLDVLGADIGLSWILTSPPGAGPGVEPGERGEPVRDVVTSCDDARKAGERVDRQLRRAVAGIKAAVVIVDGLHPVDTQDELDQVRLERRLTTLQSDLEASRTVLAGTTRSLGAVADRARQARPVTGHARGHLPAERQRRRADRAGADPVRRAGAGPRPGPDRPHRRPGGHPRPGRQGSGARPPGPLPRSPGTVGRDTPVTGTSMAAVPPLGPAGDLGSQVVRLLVDLDRLRGDLDVWDALAHAGAQEVGVRVLIDQAEDLRRRLRDAAEETGRLTGQVSGRLREAHPRRGVTGCPVAMALVVGASSLHAASHGIGPAASALCGQDHLAATMSSSALLARRFLATAAGALRDADRLLSAHQEPDPAGPRGSPRLRLVHSRQPRRHDGDRP
ncbi:hypothetical protein [Ornithinimicrobium sp. LYQ103]|uniref:hypothetical protein n=1 Tax=Ornithinimicrobium sp. LYQ103 TaxID=3378796 RepID=UPI003853F883